MKIASKRFLFYVLFLISTAGTVCVTVAIVLGAALKLPNFPTASLLVLMDMLLLFLICFFGRYQSNRKNAAAFFCRNQALLDRMLRDLSALPIAEITSRESGMPYVSAGNGLYLHPEATATDSDTQTAAAIAEKLYAELTQQERADYPDYSDNTLHLCIRKKYGNVWLVQVKSAGYGLKQTLYFSPSGKTRELQAAAFFPPKKLADGWFV